MGMSNPAECGLNVDQVFLQNKLGFMQRSMLLLEKPGSPTVTDNLRVIEYSREITYRSVVNAVESQEEKVFAPSWLPSPPSSRCGSPSRSTTSAAHPSST